MKTIIPIVLILVVALFSCQKETSGTEETGNTAIIAKGAWKYDGGGVDIDKNGTVDMMFPATMLQPCVIDNTLTFSTNGSGTMDEGALKCDAGSPQTMPFSWAFTDNETTINITGNALSGVSGNFKILELSNTQFRLSKDTTLTGFPGSGALIFTFKH